MNIVVENMQGVIICDMTNHPILLRIIVTLFLGIIAFIFLQFIGSTEIWAFIFAGMICCVLQITMYSTKKFTKTPIIKDDADIKTSNFGLELFTVRENELNLFDSLISASISSLKSSKMNNTIIECKGCGQQIILNKEICECEYCGRKYARSDFC